MRKRPEAEPRPEEVARPVDWNRIRTGSDGGPAARERPPFRMGGGTEGAAGGSEVDPWKELLERGSMQEVLASVRRVAGVPDDDEAPRRPAGEQRPAARRETSPPAREPSVTARRRPTPPSGSPPPRATAATARVPSQPPRATATPPRRSEPSTVVPEDHLPPAPPQRERAASRPAVHHTPLPEEELAGVRRRRAGPAAVPEGDGASARDPESGVRAEARVIPRRPGLVPSAAGRREGRSYGTAALLLISLVVVAVGVGVVARMQQWTIPWAISFADLGPSAGDPSPTADPALPGAASSGGSERAGSDGGDVDPSAEVSALTSSDMAEGTPSVPTFDEGAGGPLVEQDEEPSSRGGVVARADPARPDIAPLFIGRVFVHYSTVGGEEEARGRALEVARSLEQRGYRIAAVRPVDFAIQSGSVRYFFPDDLGAAARLQEDLPATTATRTRLMDFTSYEPRPQPGTIELWLDESS